MNIRNDIIKAINDWKYNFVGLSEIYDLLDESFENIEEDLMEIDIDMNGEDLIEEIIYNVKFELFVDDLRKGTMQMPGYEDLEIDEEETKALEEFLSKIIKKYQNNEKTKIEKVNIDKEVKDESVLVNQKLEREKEILSNLKEIKELMSKVYEKINTSSLEDSLNSRQERTKNKKNSRTPG